MQLSFKLGLFTELCHQTRTAGLRKKFCSKYPQTPLTFQCNKSGWYVSGLWR